MPPPAVKTIRQLIFCQYAKIVSDSSGFGKKNYGMIMSTYKERAKRYNDRNKNYRKACIQNNQFEKKPVYKSKKIKG